MPSRRSTNRLLTGLFATLLGLVCAAAGATPPEGPPPEAALSDLSNRFYEATREWSVLKPDRPPLAEIQPRLREFEAEFISLLDRHPDHPRVLEEVRRFYEISGNRWMETPSPALLEVISRAPEPGRLALRIAGDGGAAERQLAIPMLLAALTARPNEVAVWNQLAQVKGGVWSVALYEETARRLGAPGRAGVPVLVQVAVAARQLTEQIEAGLAERAVETFRDLPPEVRSQILLGAHGRLEATVDDLAFEAEWEDLRLELAAAHVIARDDRTAAELLRSYDAAPDGLLLKKATRVSARYSGRLPDRPRQRQLLALWLTPSREDPFALLTSQMGFPSPSRSDSAVFARFLARLAGREGYPTLVDFFLEPPIRSLRPTPSGYLPGDLPPAAAVPPRVRQTAHRLAQEVQELQRRLTEEAAAAVREARAALGPDPAAPVAARWLQQPFAPPFQARPLPEGVAMARPLMDQLREQGLDTGEDGRLPAGFRLVRLEADGNRVTALGRREHLGYLSEYWVFLSADGGRTWEPPLYTGLLPARPYIASGESALPLRNGDRLQPEVEFWVKGSPLPAGSAGPGRAGRGLVLDIPVAGLRRDTDGDGLTDLEEQRLLTDPRQADTDGDSLADAEDPLPNVAWERTPSTAARAVAAALTTVPAIEQSLGHLTGGSVSEAACCLPPHLTAEEPRVVWFTGERALFAGIQADRRIAVLTPDEEAGLREHHRFFDVFSIRWFVLDRSARNAILYWHGSSTGGVLRLREEEGVWKVETMQDSGEIVCN